MRSREEIVQALGELQFLMENVEVSKSHLVSEQVAQTSLSFLQEEENLLLKSRSL